MLSLNFFSYRGDVHPIGVSRCYEKRAQFIVRNSSDDRSVSGESPVSKFTGAIPSI